MSVILNSLRIFFQNHTTRPVVVAYSGGVDSQVLLHGLCSLKKQKHINNHISVVHVNHGLSSNATDWQSFANNQCQQFDVDFKCITVTIEQRPRQSIEALARDKRYQALENNCCDDALIATGHHQDDQIETFLLALKRGSGPKGLSSMEEYSSFGKKNQNLTRPLLSCSRADILAYANANKLAWIEDESNEDIKYDRNFLRHEIIPKFNERWPSFNQTLVRSISHIRETQNLIDEIAEQDLKLCIASPDSLFVLPLQSLSKVRFNHVIRYFLALNSYLMPSQAQLLELRRQIFSAQDKTPEIKLADVWFRQHQQKLYLTPTFQAIENWQIAIPIKNRLATEVRIDLPDKLGSLLFKQSNVEEIDMASKSTQSSNNVSQYFSLPENYKQLVIKFRHDNPKCLPENRQHRRSLKKVLQESGVPPWQRKRLPFVYADGELVAVIGLFICKPFIVEAEKINITVCWLGR